MGSATPGGSLCLVESYGLPSAIIVTHRPVARGCRDQGQQSNTGYCLCAGACVGLVSRWARPGVISMRAVGKKSKKRPGSTSVQPAPLPPSSSASSSSSRPLARSGGGFGNDAGGGGDSKEVAETSRRTDPLIFITPSDEDRIWNGPFVKNFIAKALQFDLAVTVGYFMQSLLKQYAVLATKYQIEHFPESIWPTGIMAVDALENPLSWRPLMNSPAGIKAFVFDAFLLRSCEVIEGSKRSHARGFGAEDDRKSDGASDLVGILGPEHDLHRWVFFRTLAKEFYTRSDSAWKMPKIYIPVEFARRLRLIDTSKVSDQFEECDIEEYIDYPPMDELVSDAHCVVLVMAEPYDDVEETSWNLPRKTDPDVPGVADAAPIVVVRALQHNIGLKATWMDKFAMVCARVLNFQDMEEETLRQIDTDARLSQLPFAEQLSGMFKGFSPSARSSDALDSLVRKLRSGLAPLVERAYAEGWNVLRQGHLKKLTKEQQSLQTMVKQQRARQESAVKLRADLMGAITTLNVAKFTDNLEQAPFKRALTSRGSAEASDSLRIDDKLSELKSILAETQLTSSNQWVKGAQDLKAAMAACQDLSTALKADFEAQPQLLNDFDGLLSRATSAVGSLQGRLQGLLQDTTADAVFPELEGLLEQAYGVTQDVALRRALRGRPWSGGQVVMRDIDSEALTRLEDLAAAASDAARASVGEALEQAFAAGRCAIALRELLEESESLVLLEERLGQALDLGLRGLEVAEARLLELRELRALEPEFRERFEAAVATLDEAGLEDALTSAQQRGLRISDADALRETLAASMQEAESPLRGVLDGVASIDTLDAALSSSRLPAGNAWRELVAAVRDAFEATDTLQESQSEATPIDAVALQTQLEECAKSARDLERLAQPLGWPNCAQLAAAALREALRDGATRAAVKAAADAAEDEALYTALRDAPWNCAGLRVGQESQSAQLLAVSWQDVRPGDINVLKNLSERASPAGKACVEAVLSAAFDMGQCAVDLRAALTDRDAETADELMQQAKTLGLRKLDSAEQRLQDLLRPEPAAGTEEPLVALQAAKPAGARVGQIGDDVLNAQTTNLIFIDLELTAGFYEFDQRACILESAVIVCDKDLNELARGRWVIGGFSSEKLDSLSDFHQVNFRDIKPGGKFPPRFGSEGGNGLFADVISSILTKEEVEVGMLELIQQHCPPGICPLVGYSVQCDREVLKDEMPRLYRYVSHRIVDVSSFYHMAKLWLPEKVRQGQNRASFNRHRALDDAEDSIDALRWARNHIFQKRGEGTPPGSPWMLTGAVEDSMAARQLM